MKTQISSIRCGSHNQFLNKDIDYSKLPRSTTNANMHSGSSEEKCNQVWRKVVDENFNWITIKIFDYKFTLIANHSKSGKSTTYWINCTDEFAQLIGITPTKVPNMCWLSIQSSKHILVGNGKNSYRYVCPSLITIL
jgi:hypothetical protein